MSSLRLSLTPVALACGALALLALACRQPACPAPSVSSDIRLGVERRSDNALIADATVDLARPAAMYLEYGNPQVGWLRTPTASIVAGQRLPIVRLRAQTAYQVRAFTLDDAGCPSAAGQAEVTTGDLPAQFKRLSLTANGSPSFPLTLLDVQVEENDLHWLVAFNPDGQLVWYYPIPRYLTQAAAGRAVHGLVRLTNGNFLYVTKRIGVEEIAPDGRGGRRIALDSYQIHHDLLELPDGRIMFLGAEDRSVDDTPNGGARDVSLRGDTINLLDLDSQSVQRVWNSWETLDPLQRLPQYQGRKDEKTNDWTHGNSISYGPRGNLLVSFRYLDQVISLSPDLKTVEWKLGGWDSSFAFPDSTDRFYGQHAARELPNGHILLFDNGNFRPEGQYSRALELDLDFSTMTARNVWQYRHTPDYFSAAASNATRLPNGNTLVNFAFPESPDDPVGLAEARSDGTTVWEAALRLKGQRATSYRAYPLESLAGEMVIQPTPVRN